MAKISFTKLGLSKVTDTKEFVFNEQTVEVKQYLPINDKLELISNVINLSADDNNFANPVKLKVFTILEILYAYTNINFTEKQKEDPTKLYDLVVGNGFVKQVIDNMAVEEYNELVDSIRKCAESIYTYRNSVMGILDNVSKDYSNLSLDAENIQKMLADPGNMAFLKDVVTKLG